MADNSNINGGTSPGDGASSSYFKERLLSDAEKVSQKDLDELDTSLPKKISSFEMKSLADGIGWINTLLDRVRTIYDMLRDRDYHISVRTKALVGAALLYFVLPTDIIPDFIPGIGYIDDALVLSTLWKLIGDEIDAFLGSRGARPAAAEGSAPAEPSQAPGDAPAA
jgi:uncharacterized membrane protein YkvA (DUF1232 family)